MAKLVEIIGVGHNPVAYTRMRNPNASDPKVLRIKAGYEQMRQRLASSRPDVLLCVGNDHLNQLFMDNMPAFLVGKSPVVEGPWPWERRMGMPEYRAPVDVPLAKGIIRGGFDHTVDFAYSDELRVDHAFTMPLDLLRPERDLPIVPLLCNVMAPPVPPAKRFYQVGESISAIIAEYPEDTRVAAICSGHLAVEIGGPRGVGSLDPEFDTRSVELVGTGDVDGVFRELTWERFWRAGNYTAGFLTFILLMGMAGGKPADHWETIHSDMNGVPFLAWDVASNGGEAV